jgi:hypothetical protein
MRRATRVGDGWEAVEKGKPAPRRGGPTRNRVGANQRLRESTTDNRHDADSCLVCLQQIDRKGDLCTRCIQAFIEGVHRRREAELRLQPLSDWGWSA